MSASGRFGFVWGMPALLALATLFGLLAALLGTGIWRWASWLALAWPPGVALRYWVRPRNS
jgi:hypothetical protein